MSQPNAYNRTESGAPAVVPPGTPRSTYRLQLWAGFDFAAAGAVVPYLASLGVSHLHLSPVLEAVPGSTHGYDVTDHTRVRAELGGEQGLRALAATAREHGLGLVLDIVPNHMAVPSPLRLNRPLWEVLREGPHSPYARWFDIDWEAGGGQLLLPVLAGPPEPEAFTVDGEVLRHGEQEFPLRTGTAGLPPAELLAAQWYRPAWWREARTALNYRRFFTISGLIAVRVEDPEVFAATHAKVVQLVREGVLQGLRVDHVDGLADPGQYLRRLRAAVGDGCWIVVEKILASAERLLPSWPVAGTTGYDALYRLDGVFTDPEGAAELAHRYRKATGAADWAQTAERSAREVLTVDLAAELAALERRAGPAAARAVRELLIAYPVYRPYPGTDGYAGMAEVARAAGVDPGEAEAVRERALADPGFAARFAQTSAALRAKSLEDRAFYRWAPLLSATEVGGEPARPAVPVEEFHAYCAELERDWPQSGTVLSTHDTKRSADVRARISVLSQAPELMGRPEGPDPQLDWVARQTALGLGEVPDRAERLEEALLKAAREAALHTGWTDPDEAYEAAVGRYARAAARSADLLAEAAAAEAARANLLGTALLHLAMPGVPEVYQGAETEYRALVDPDNRRPAQFARAALARLDAGALPRDQAEEKVELTAALLRLRRDRPPLFTGYTPLAARGPAAGHCVAFVRGAGLLAAATRLAYRLAAAGGWRDTVLVLPPGRWTSLLAPAVPYEGEVRLAELFGDRPVGLLLRDG